MQPSRNDDLRKAYRITAVIGLAIMASLIVYTVVVELIKKQNAPFVGYAPVPPDVLSTLRYVLMGVVVVEFFVILLLNRLIRSGKAPLGSSPATAPFAPNAQRLVTASVVSYALCESVAIYGLVLFLIQGNTGDFYLFIAVSLFYFIVFFPRYGNWEKWIAEKEREQTRRP